MKETPVSRDELLAYLKTSKYWLVHFYIPFKRPHFTDIENINFIIDIVGKKWNQQDTSWQVECNWYTASGASVHPGSFCFRWISRDPCTFTPLTRSQYLTLKRVFAS